MIPLYIKWPLRIVQRQRLFLHDAINLDRYKEFHWECQQCILKVEIHLQFIISLFFALQASNCFSQPPIIAWTCLSARLTLASFGLSIAKAEPHSSTMRCNLTQATNRLSLNVADGDLSIDSEASDIKVENRSIFGRRRLTDALQILVNKVHFNQGGLLTLHKKRSTTEAFDGLPTQYCPVVVCQS